GHHSCNDLVGQQFGHYFDVSVAAVVDQPKFPEFMHEKHDLRRSRSHDFGQLDMSDTGNVHVSRPGVLSCTGEFQKCTGQTQLAVIEKLIAEIFFHVDVPGQQRGQELFGELGLKANSLKHCTLLDSEYF